MSAYFPSSINTKVKYLDRYTVRDVLRAGVLAAAGWYMFGGPEATVGIAAGLILAETKPDGRPVENLVLDRLSRTVSAPSVSSPGLRKFVDGSVILEDNTVLGVVKVSSQSIEYVSEPVKEAGRDTVREMLDEVDRPIEIYSRQRLLDLSEVQGAGGSTATTDHYVLVKESDTSLKESHRRVRKRCEEIRNLLTAADLSAERLTGSSLKSAVKQLYLGDIEISGAGYETEHGQKPVSRLLYVDSYPGRLPLGWTAEILNTETKGLIDVVQVVSPVSDSQRDWMDRMLARIEAEITGSRRMSRQAGLRQKEQDLEDLIDVEAGNGTLVNYGVYIVARGDTPTEAEQTLGSVRSVLKRFRVESRGPEKPYQAVKAVSPFLTGRFDRSEIVPAHSAATGFSFGTDDMIEHGGISVGRHRNGSPVVLNRFSWDAGHTTVMGKIGSGKTYWAKLMILRSIRTYDDLDVYIIDPKRRDYGGLVDSLEGETRFVDDLTGCDNDVVRYTVDDPSRDNTEELAETVRYVYRQAVKTESKTLVVIDETHRIITKGNSIYQGGVNAVSTLIRGTRDRDVAATLITQNADEFTRSNEGKNILRNVDCSLFFKQRDVDSQVTEFFRFSEKEKRELRRLRTGNKTGYSEALIHGSVNTRIKIEAEDQEHQLIEDKEREDKNSLSDRTVTGDSESVRETDGGQKINSGDEQPGEAESLLSRLDTVLRSPIGLFEYMLLAGFSAAMFLYWIGALRPGLHSVQTFLNPGNAGFLMVSLFGLAGFETVWIVLLSVDIWLNHSGR